MHLTVGYLATPTGDDGVALASAANKQEPRQIQVAAAEENLVAAARTPRPSACSSARRQPASWRAPKLR
jgi:hypothetical protein